MTPTLSQLSPIRLALTGAARCLGIGAVIGALELLPVTLQSVVPMTVAQVAGFVALNVVAFAALGGLVGAVLGVLTHLAMRRWVVSRGMGVQMALTVFALSGYVFGGLAWEEWAGGRPWAAGFLLVFPFLGAGVTFLVASRLWRIVEDGGSPPAPFLPAAGGVALALGLVSAGIVLGRGQGGTGALPTDPNFVVIVVDSLRADLGSGAAPAIDRLATLGVVFPEAVTPSPETAPAVASLFSGLTPLAHGVMEDGDDLRRVRTLLPYVFASEGYAVGGFVSASALSAERGFAYGYHTYDDDFGPWPGLARTRLGRDLGFPLGWVGRSRPDRAAVDGFLRWLDHRKDVPFFAFVHLHGPREPFEPHGRPGFEANGTPAAPVLRHADLVGRLDLGPTEMRMLHRLYEEEVAEVDGQIGRILDALAQAGLTDETVVVLTATGGELLAEHGNAYTYRGLYDETVRIPMLIAVPGVQGDRAVPGQVRLHDLYPTLLEHAQISSRQENSAISLLNRAKEGRGEALWSPLLGRDIDGGWLVGARNNGWKYIRRLDDAEERLYQTADDPEEKENLASSLPDTLAEARNLVIQDLGRMGRALGITPK